MSLKPLDQARDQQAIDTVCDQKNLTYLLEVDAKELRLVRMGLVNLLSNDLQEKTIIESLVNKIIEFQINENKMKITCIICNIETECKQRFIGDMIETLATCNKCNATWRIFTKASKELEKMFAKRRDAKSLIDTLRG